MTKLLNNKYLSGLISLLLALYAVYVAPALPNQVLQFFDTPIGRLLFIFLAAYLASEGNTQVALMISIALTISLMALEKKTIEESFYDSQSRINRELRFENFESSNPHEEDTEPEGIVTSSISGASTSKDTSTQPVHDSQLTDHDTSSESTLENWDSRVDVSGYSSETQDENEPSPGGGLLRGGGVQEHFAPYSNQE